MSVDASGRRTDRSARRFYASAREKPNRPGTWSSQLMTVFDDGVAIGEYERTYHSYGSETFEAFELNGRWYALYSAEYTATRIMSLPDCKDIGGEEPHSEGFCPVDLFIPRYRVRTSQDSSRPEAREEWVVEREAERAKDHTFDVGKDHVKVTLGPWQTLTTGFVAGCHWGDDTSWKLQTFDLSRVGEGVLVRSERFGFVELPGGFSLGRAVTVGQYSGRAPVISLIREETRDLKTGAFIHPYEL